MPVTVVFPKVSLETASGKVARWLVAEGDTVQTGQILFEIENDKAAVEVESPAAGTIAHLTPEETEVEVGSAVATIYAAGEQPAAQSTPTPTPVTATPTRIATPTQPRGTLPTPLARRIARDENISIDGLTGTGPHGRIQKKDVLAHLATLTHRPTLNHAWLRRGNGVPLVLLHGFSGDLNNWRGLFAGTRMDNPVLALDLPGHGQSPLDVPPDMDALVAQVEHSIAAQVSGGLILAGHSFGAAVATRIAAGGRLDVRSLCLIAPAGLGPEINTGFTTGILRGQSADSLRPWLQELVHDPAVISDAFLKAVVDQRANTALTEAMRRFADRFLPDGTQSQSILQDLARMTLPIKVIFGRQDRILPFARTADLPGNVALHALQNCGHMPHLEQPALCLRLLGELLRS